MPDTLAAAWGNLRRRPGPKLAEDGFKGEMTMLFCVLCVSMVDNFFLVYMLGGASTLPYRMFVVQGMVITSMQISATSDDSSTSM